MEKSQSIVNIAKALSQFQAKIGKLAKDSDNPFFKSKYLSLSGLLEGIKNPLQDSGLTVSQFPTGQNGLTSILMHTDSGEYMQADYFMTPSKSDPQAQGSAITYMRRYALAAILLINIDEDDDANAATHGNPQQNQKTIQKNNQSGEGKEKPWLNKLDKSGNETELWKRMINGIKSGKGSVAMIESTYRMNKENKAELMALEKKD